MHVRTADLVHQQHEDEAQDQRNADAGVKLLVGVLVFATGAQNRFDFGLGLRHFCNPTTVSVILVATWGGTGQIHLMFTAHTRLRKTKATTNFVLYK